jgi:hypothetical protein
LGSLIKTLICGMSDVFFYSRLCFIFPFVSLILFFLFFSSVFLFLLGVYFVLNDIVYFIEWNIVTLISAVIMTFFFHWMSLSFMGFLFLFPLSSFCIEMIICMVA